MTTRYFLGILLALVASPVLAQTAGSTGDIDMGTTTTYIEDGTTQGTGTGGQSRSLGGGTQTSGQTGATGAGSTQSSGTKRTMPRGHVGAPSPDVAYDPTFTVANMEAEWKRRHSGGLVPSDRVIRGRWGAAGRYNGRSGQRANVRYETKANADRRWAAMAHSNGDMRQLLLGIALRGTPEQKQFAAAYLQNRLAQAKHPRQRAELKSLLAKFGKGVSGGKPKETPAQRKKRIAEAQRKAAETALLWTWIKWIVFGAACLLLWFGVILPMIRKRKENSLAAHERGDNSRRRPAPRYDDDEDVEIGTVGTYQRVR